MTSQSRLCLTYARKNQRFFLPRILPSYGVFSSPRLQDLIARLFVGNSFFEFNPSVRLVFECFSPVALGERKGEIVNIRALLDDRTEKRWKDGKPQSAGAFVSNLPSSKEYLFSLEPCFPLRIGSFLACAVIPVSQQNDPLSYLGGNDLLRIGCAYFSSCFHLKDWNARPCCHCCRQPRGFATTYIVPCCYSACGAYSSHFLDQ